MSKKYLKFHKSKNYIEESSHHIAGGVNSSFRTGMKQMPLDLYQEQELICLIWTVINSLIII